MSRAYNTDKNGKPYSDALRMQVWSKAQVVHGCNPNLIRKDSCGALIHWAKYGYTIQYGWEIDHIKPVVKGGDDTISNLQPLQWQNNRKKGDDYPAANYCAVKS